MVKRGRHGQRGLRAVYGTVRRMTRLEFVWTVMAPLIIGVGLIGQVFLDATGWSIGDWSSRPFGTHDLWEPLVGALILWGWWRWRW